MNAELDLDDGYNAQLKPVENFNEFKDPIHGSMNIPRMNHPDNKNHGD